MNQAQIWWMAARPKTLGATIGPLVMGTAMAAADGGFHAGSAFACLVVVLLLQIGTNFCNDYSDFKKGTDNADRVGPTRATQAGYVTPRAMGTATMLTFTAAFVVSLYLIHRGGWPLTLIMLSGIACGILYTAGPRPLGYLGLGDLVVLIFFGPVAVAGTHYVQTGFWSIDAVVLGFAPGLLAVGILVMNNLRDRVGDAAAGKRTLAVRFGVRFSQFQYAFCLIAPLLLVAAVVVFRGVHYGALSVFILLIPIYLSMKVVFAYQRPEQLIPMLGQTARILMLFSALFAWGWCFT